MDAFDFDSAVNLAVSLDSAVNKQTQPLTTAVQLAGGMSGLSGISTFVQGIETLFPQSNSRPVLRAPQNSADWTLLIEQGRQSIASGNARKVQVSQSPDPRVVTLTQERSQQIAAVQPTSGIVLGIGLFGELDLPFVPDISGNIAAGLYIPQGAHVGFYTSFGGSFSVSTEEGSGIVGLEILVVWGGLSAFAGTSFSLAAYAGDEGYAGGAAIIFSPDTLSPIGFSIFGGGGTPSVTGAVRVAHTWAASASEYRESA